MPYHCRICDRYRRNKKFLAEAVAITSGKISTFGHREERDHPERMDELLDFSSNQNFSSKL